MIHVEKKEKKEKKERKVKKNGSNEKKRKTFFKYYLNMYLLCKCVFAYYILDCIYELIEWIQ